MNEKLGKENMNAYKQAKVVVSDCHIPAADRETKLTKLVQRTELSFLNHARAPPILFKLICQVKVFLEVHNE